MTIFYVDGKTGSDSNPGTIGSPVATIAHAASLLASPGDKVVVAGYNDYVYRERPLIGGFSKTGTSSSPYVFEASGYVTGSSSYIKPIVDGSALVDVATYGSLSWTQPNAGTYPTLWSTPWPTSLSYNDSGAGRVDYMATERADRAWLNSSPVAGYSVPLRRPLPAGGAGTAITLADLAGAGFTYFFDRWSGTGGAIASVVPGSIGLPATGRLYVNLAANSTALGNLAYPAPSSTNPTAGGNTLEMPYQSTFYVDNASSYITIHGFRVWHGDLGLSVKGGSHHIVLEDCECSYNFDCGLILQGGSGAEVHDCTVRRNSGTGNSIQLIKVDGYTHDCLLDSNDGYQNYLQSFADIVGIHVHDLTITGNRGRDGNLVPDYTRYYPPATAQIWGMVLEDGCSTIAITGNEFYGNSNGIGTYVPGSNQFSGVSITGNYLHNNTVRGSITGTGYGISFGSGDTGTVVFTGNHCPGNTGTSNLGIWFAYVTTGKTLSPNDLLVVSLGGGGFLFGASFLAEGATTGATVPPAIALSSPPAVGTTYPPSTDVSDALPARGYLLPAFSPGLLSRPTTAAVIFAPLDRALDSFRAWTDQLKAAHTITTATGTDLDDLGAWLGIPRLPAETDFVYRARIPGTVAHGVSASNGMDLAAVLSAGQGIPVIIQDWPTPPGFTVTLLGNTATLSSVPALVRSYKAAGVPFTVRALLGGGNGPRAGRVRAGRARAGSDSGSVWLA